MQLRDFQVTGSAFLQAHNAALLCDDAGLGKSATVLDAADKLGLQRVLCIGPAVAGVSWPIQLATWSPARTFVNVDLGQQFGFDLPGFYFVSFDTLSLRKNRLLVAALAECKAWDAVVLDEGQYLKNLGANRTKAVYGDKCDGRFHRADPAGRRPIVFNSNRAWVLSGTLTPNHAGEAYTHLRALFVNTLTNIPAFNGRVPEQHEFENYFCDVRDTVYGRAISGSRNMRELRQAIAPVLLRRRKADVLQELPAIEWLTAPIDLDPDVVRTIYRDGVASMGIDYDTALGLPDESLDCLADQLAAVTPNLSAQRKNLGIAKVPGCVRWIVDRLEAGEPKVIVFAHHTAVLNTLLEQLTEYTPAMFQGATPPDEREAAVRIFQNDPNCRVFVGQIQAAGTAITLTAAKCVFFAEYSSTPGINYQAASRAHRMGQRDGVQCYFASVPGSLDERIAATARRRARDIAEIFD